jgi:hypothetical protein
VFIRELVMAGLCLLEYLWIFVMAVVLERRLIPLATFTIGSLVMRCRILVYATYSSVQLVPRDVVFRQPLVGRFTAHVYIRNSEFADVIPANEGPMHIDGNPHPLRGGFVPDNNMFVLPEYPANGWNEAPAAPQLGHEQSLDHVNVQPADSASGVTMPSFTSGSDCHDE